MENINVKKALQTRKYLSTVKKKKKSPYERKLLKLTDGKEAA